MSQSLLLPPQLAGNPAGQAALAGIIKILESANKPKPEAVAELVDARMAQVVHLAQEAVGNVRAEAVGKIQSLAQTLVAAVQQTEAKLPAKIDGLIVDAIERLAPRKVQVVTRDGLHLAEIDDHVRPEFDAICKRIALGLHCFVAGPAGAGKTHLAEQLARALGLRFAFLSLTAGVSESRLVGRFAPIGENGRFEYVPAPFVDFYENGGLFLLDEVDAADANVMLTLNSALANGHMETPNPAKPIIKRHKDFRLIAAANTWGHGADRQYVGRNQLDASTLDRFCAAKFALDYDEEFERKAGHQEVVEWVHQLRRAVRQHSVRRVVSTRLVLNGSVIVKAGGHLNDVKASYFMDWTENEKRLVGQL